MLELLALLQIKKFYNPLLNVHVKSVHLLFVELHPNYKANYKLTLIYHNQAGM